MDKILMLQIRRFVGRNNWLDGLMVHIAKYGPLWFFVALGGLVWSGGHDPVRAVLSALVAAVITRGVNEGIGRLFFRERPFVQEEFVPLLEHEPTSSFPSNHAACGFALAVAVWWLVPGAGSLLVLFACVLAFSRVYVGVHYPADVLIGAGVGSLVAYGTVAAGLALFP
jgi:undecaprenyl-diphosphatase